MKWTIFAALLLAGCGGGGSAPGPLPVVPATTGTVATQAAPFAVLGDSISAGYTMPSATSVPTYTIDPAKAWPAFASQMTGRPVVNLAIAGGDELNARLQVPNIPRDAAFVVYAGGTNDIAHAALSTPTLLLRIGDIVSLIQAQAPNAKIVFLNVHRFAGIVDDSAIGAYGLDSTIWDQTTAWNAQEKSYGFPVVDVQDQWFNSPALYPDGVHPSPAQVQTLATMISAALR